MLFWIRIGVGLLAALALAAPLVPSVRVAVCQILAIDGDREGNFRRIEYALESARDAVALGEATHGTREFFQMKHRMLEFLVTQMGFSIFSIEANMPQADRLNDFVLKGQG